jgi:hypothetical protein
MRTWHLDKFHNLLLGIHGQTIAIIGLQSQDFISLVRNKTVLARIYFLALCEFVMISAIRLYDKASIRQKEVTSETAYPKLLYICDAIGIKNGGKGFFDGSALFAFKPAFIGAINILAPGYVRGFSRNVFAADGTRSHDSLDQRRAMAFVRAKFVGQVDAWGGSGLERPSAMLTNASLADGVLLPVKHLTLRRAKVFRVLLGTSRLYLVDNAALRARDLALAVPAKAFSAAKVPLCLSVIASLGRELFAASITHNFGHKKRLLSRTVNALAEGAQPTIRGGHNYSFVRSNRQATASLSHSIVPQMEAIY